MNFLRFGKTRLYIYFVHELFIFGFSVDDNRWAKDLLSNAHFSLSETPIAESQLFHCETVKHSIEVNKWSLPIDS